MQWSYVLSKTKGILEPRMNADEHKYYIAPEAQLFVCIRVYPRFGFPRMVPAMPG
jgi:hypothetical protein